MISFNQINSPQVLNNHISVQVAASYSGYSTQYLRRLLRTNRLEGIKIGQMWLVEKAALDFYIEEAQDSTGWTNFVSGTYNGAGHLGTGSAKEPGSNKFQGP